MRFEDVVGHGQLLQSLRQNIDSGRVSHAQLFVGECGWGALQVALAYVQYLHCTNRQGGDSCGQCPSCRQMAQLAHPDVHFVFPTVNPKGYKGKTKPTSDYFLDEWRALAAKSDCCFDEQQWYDAIGAENAQGMIHKKEADEVIRKLSFKAFEGEYKSVVVWLPEKMNSEAANTLLKILEEPWDKTLFLLVCEHSERLLATITSRTQTVSVGRIEPEELANYAISRLGATPDEAHSAAALADGSILALRGVLAEEGREAGADNFSLFVQLMRLSYQMKHLELFDWADQVAALGREAQKSFLEYSLRLIRESYMLTAGADGVSYLWGEELAFCNKFAPFVANHNVEGLVREMELALRDITQNGNARIVLSHFALAVSKLIAAKPKQ